MNEPAEPAKDLWTQILDFLSQIVTPSWNDLILLLPIGITGLVLLGLLPVWMAWRRSAAINQPRVPRPVRGGRPPEGVHLPGPSRWPFVVPIGAMFVLLALALAPRDETGAVTSPFNLPLLGLGLLVAAIGAAGWLWDALREWRSAEYGAHHGPVSGLVTASAGAGALLPAGAFGGTTEVPVSRVEDREPPPGIHLPGPSPWPFFAPLGMMVMFIGIVFSPILMVGGLIMGIIAAVGWYRDAGSEYHQVDAGHTPEPHTRDPEQAFPKRLVPLYLAIAAVTVVLSASPFLFSLLPATAAPGASPSGEPPTAEPVVVARDVTSFATPRIVVPADTPLKLTFDNQQAGVPHNVAIYDSPDRGTELFKSPDLTGPAKETYDVEPLAAGEYFFVCTIHPPMTGTLISQ